ncbi:Putative transmembrane protein (fragment) [Pseudorhizobium banfieldiae]|uniref:Putative transmembrane protein n=1 Tax=Pseudorhizobium banfieldiae TaxID=1125847 RepID=L0NH71_9HYPH
MIDLDHPFYKPLWARLLIVGVCVGWAGLEFWSGAPVWGMIVGGLGIYSAYKLFYEFNRRPSADAAQKSAQEERQ